MFRKFAVTFVLLLAFASQASATSPEPGEGWFEFKCSVVVPGAQIDPLVFPGNVGTSHVHQFVGNRSINENSTNESLRANPATSCLDDEEEKRGTPEAQRVYGNAIWYPRFYENGAPLTATRVTAGYSVGFVRDFANIVPFTDNMNFIAGTSSGGPQEINGQSVYKLVCPTGTTTPGTATRAPLCNQPNLRVSIFAPDCWDGLNSDSANHKTHLAYSKRAVGATLFTCPASHPVLVPAQRITIELPSRGGSGLTVATGSGATANTQGNMSTIHYDYMSAIAGDARTQRTRDCLNQNEYCGGTSKPVPGEGGGI